MISISGLTKTYGGNVQALRGLDLELGTGIFGLLGPNGAGKTTLIRILATLLPPTSGRVLVFGHDVKNTHSQLAIKAILGYLPQELGLYPDLTAIEFLEFVASLKGIKDRSRRKVEIADTIDLVGLSQDAKRRLKTFSGGMKRRVGIAQALLGKPKLLIVDEPTSGLDPEERVHLRNILVSIATDSMVILSTHIIEDINQSCTNMGIINNGQLLFHGNPMELISKMRGRVWSLKTTTPLLPSDLIVVSSLQAQGGMQYRVIGNPNKDFRAKPTAPTLEDGYLWLMNQVRQV